MKLSVADLRHLGVSASHVSAHHAPTARLLAVSGDANNRQNPVSGPLHWLVNRTKPCCKNLLCCNGELLWLNQRSSSVGLGSAIYMNGFRSQYTMGVAFI